MPAEPHPRWVEWVADELGVSGGALRARPLRPDGGPWVIGVDGAATAVLRMGAGSAGADSVARDASAMRYVADHGVPVPRVLAHRAEHELGLELIEYVDGRSAVPRERDDERLRRLGAVAARIAAVPAPPSYRRRSGPIESVDFARLRRESPHPLLERGAAALTDRRPADPTDCLVHGDLWQGNTLWRGNELAAVIDWDNVGRGPAGIDLGAVRFDAALFFGVGAEDAVLEGWAAEAGRPAADVAYWDLAAAVASPPDLAWFVPTMINDGRRPDLDRPTLIDRRDRFLESALDRLDG